MKDKKKTKSDLLRDLRFLQEHIEETRMVNLYLNYDAECLRREKVALQETIAKLRNEK